MAAWAAMLAVAAVLGQAPETSAGSCSGQRVTTPQRGTATYKSDWMTKQRIRRLRRKRAAV